MPYSNVSTKPVNHTQILHVNTNTINSVNSDNVLLVCPVYPVFGTYDSNPNVVEHLYYYPNRKDMVNTCDCICNIKCNIVKEDTSDIADTLGITLNAMNPHSFKPFIRPRVNCCNKK